MIGTLDRVELAMELTPILTELVNLQPGNYQHPAVRQLSEWLEDPQRTGEEFTYVIGELAEAVSCDMGKEDQDEVYLRYLGKVASEALVVKCPILKDSWEEAAWVVLYLCDNYFFWENFDKQDYASERLSNWIIPDDWQRQHLSESHLKV